MIRLGLRLTLAGGREAVVRLVLLVASVGLSVGLLSLVGYERWMGRAAARARTVALPTHFGPGTAHAVRRFQKAALAS